MPCGEDEQPIVPLLQAVGEAVECGATVTELEVVGQAAEQLGPQHSVSQSVSQSVSVDIRSAFAPLSVWSLAHTVTTRMTTANITTAACRTYTAVGVDWC